MDYIEKDFGKILKNNAQTIRHEFLPFGTDCFRAYDRNLGRYPVTVDVYGKYAKVTDYGEEPLAEELRETCLDICSRMLYLEKGNVIYCFRAKRAERKQHERTESEAVVTIVHENGLSFKVDLTTYVDTGLFLDHSVTRSMIKERSTNADVLNLFSYTGGFSVYAASGLANSVTSVDMSATYTKWAQENLELNGFSGNPYQCICMDATRFISKAMDEGKKYDIIIFDPPSFSNSHKMEGDFDVARDYVTWIKNLFCILKKTGFILFSTNLGSFQMDRRRLRGLSVKEISGALVAPGFVRGRIGTTRSWMMAFDDDSLSLDWSESEKKSEKSTDGAERKSDRTERRADDRRSSRKDGERDYSSRNRGFSDRSDRSGRSFRSERGDRPFNRERRERDGRDRDDSRSSYGRRDRYSDGGQRDHRYGSRPSFRDRDNQGSEGYDKSERFDRSDRSDRADRPFRSYREHGDHEGGFERRSFDRRPHDDRRPSYGRDRSFGDRRSFNRDENGENREERRSFRSERSDRPRSDRDYSDRPRFERGERAERRTFERKGSDGSSKKPYGFDSFKPARSREDSTDFFWNTDDLDPKPKKED